MSYSLLINIFGRDVADIIVSFENKYARGAYDHVIVEFKRLVEESNRRISFWVLGVNNLSRIFLVLKENPPIYIFNLQLHTQKFLYSIRELTPRGHLFLFIYFLPIQSSYLLYNGAGHKIKILDKMNFMPTSM